MSGGDRDPGGLANPPLAGFMDALLSEIPLIDPLRDMVLSPLLGRGDPLEFPSPPLVILLPGWPLPCPCCCDCLLTNLLGLGWSCSSLTARVECSRGDRGLEDESELLDLETVVFTQPVDGAGLLSRGEVCGEI